ncbi:MAG TPA: MFS transporter, partial [Steroidobacteraceae bacterium]|nr:MFS transporter [Steroidobacteraceae bacterium]
LFAATSINYVDRQILGVLKPTLQLEFGWTETSFGDVVFWFQAAYALGYFGFGRLIDRIGARLGYAAVVVLWTAAHIAHAFVGSVGGFIAVRFALGLGESGNFPAALKAIAEWFPQQERALATGIFVAGSNVGAIITPLIVPFIAYRWGWRAAFIVTGSFSIVWLVLWLKEYRRPQEHPKLSADELAFIRGDLRREPDPLQGVTTIAWQTLLKIPETWAYALARFLIDPIWWMFLFWLPDFFAKRYHLDLEHFGPPLVLVYLMSDAGSISGGWLSSRLVRAGYTVNRARKLTMLLASILVVPVMFAVHADSLWLAVALVGIATAGHQAFSATLYTFPSDVFPRQAVASVVGIGGTAGAIGGMLMAKYAGWVLDSMGSYTPIFIVAGTVYATALMVLHLLSPRLKRVAL